MKKIILIAGIILLFPISGMCAGKVLTFDCTPAADAVTGAQIQIGTGTPFDVPLVSTCGSGTDKVTCTDPASKTICYPDTSWPTGPFVAKANVRNARDVSAYSLPLAVPGVPSSPGSLRAIMQ
jgi:hypothetical protein